MTQRRATTTQDSLLAEFKLHARMTSPDLDAELRNKLLAAIEHAEGFVGCVLLRSQFITDSRIPSNRVISLRTPLVSVESVEVDGVTVESYETDGRSLTLPEGIEGKRVKVTYTAGVEELPADLKTAIFMHATALFDNPGDSVEMLQKASTNMMRRYRSWGLKEGLD